MRRLPAVRCWLKTDRPRERIVREGVSGLSDAELVALILRTGDGVLDVVAFARSLLLDFGSLTALVDAQPQALFARRGLGGAKVAALLAVRGVLERYHAEVVRDRKVISGSNATRRYLLFCCTPTSRHPNDHIRTRRSSGGL